MRKQKPGPHARYELVQLIAGLSVMVQFLLPSLVAVLSAGGMYREKVGICIGRSAGDVGFGDDSCA